MDRALRLIYGAMALLWLATACCSGYGAVAEMRREQLFTIPWGENWGQLKLVTEKELSEATYAGPSAMMVAATGEVYVFDPWTKRLQKFSADGELSAGAQFGNGVSEATYIALCRQTSAGNQPIILVCGEEVFRLEKLAAQPGSAAVTQPLRTSLAERTTVLRVGTLNPSGLFVEETGFRDRMPYVRQFDGSAYLRRFEIADLVAWNTWYYGLALDCNTEGLQAHDGSLLIKEIDAQEGTISKTIKVVLPQIEDKRLRWHLIGAGSLAPQPLLFFARNWPVATDDEILVVSESGETRGTALLTVPETVEQSSYLRHWNHLAWVSEAGDLYFGIPADKGFVMMKYRLAL